MAGEDPRSLPSSSLPLLRDLLLLLLLLLRSRQPLLSAASEIEDAEPAIT
jgi:hypothetical protein